MRQRIHAIALPSEIGDFSDEVRRVFLELGRVFGSESLADECAPPIDVYETDDTLEIAVDLPGVDPAAVRVIAKGDSILIAGEKAARRARSESSFHLVERGYGRFARVVRLARACDTAQARARLSGGELRVSVPKIGDRRGRAIPIAITTATHG
jgi:HSP20 family protein